MMCPLCESRKARRACPGKGVQICSVCCAQKREVEIDCPLACVYLREGYRYEERRVPLNEPPSKEAPSRTFPRGFIVANEPFLMELWQTIWETFHTAPQIHDADILRALTALEKTYQTLDKGLYYDSTPEESLPQLIYTKTKEKIDARLSNPDIHQAHLKLSTVLDCLAFLQQVAQMKSSGRPLSRGFLLQLEEVFAHVSPQPATSSLIVP